MKDIDVMAALAAHDFKKVNPWDSLKDECKAVFISGMQSHVESEFRAEKGLSKNIDSIKSDYWNSFISSYDKITDDDLDNLFDVFTKQGVADLLAKNKIWFKLSDRSIDLEQLRYDLTSDQKACYKVIFGDSTKELELLKLAEKEIDDIVNSYEIDHAQ